MKAMALTGLAQMGFIEVPDPPAPGPSQVLVKVSNIGVCGSDMHYYSEGKIGQSVVNYPFILGHEGAGIVEIAGPGAGHLKKGMPVAIEPAMPCGACDQCLAGREHTCRNMIFLGSAGQSDGLLKEYILMPEKSCIPIPAGMNGELATMAEPLSIAIWSVKLSGIQAGQSAGILGSGPIGMSVLIYLKHLGVEAVFVTDKLDYRLDMASKAGAGWCGNPDGQDVVAMIQEEEPLGLDHVFECCGQQEAIDQAIEILKPGGKVVIVGIPEFDHWVLPTDIIRRKELAFLNVRRQNDCMHEAIDLIASGRVDAGQLITHRFSLKDTPSAYDIVSRYENGVMKAMIKI